VSIVGNLLHATAPPYYSSSPPTSCSSPALPHPSSPQIRLLQALPTGRPTSAAARYLSRRCHTNPKPRAPLAFDLVRVVGLHALESSRCSRARVDLVAFKRSSHPDVIQPRVTQPLPSPVRTSTQIQLNSLHRAMIRPTGCVVHFGMGPLLHPSLDLARQCCPSPDPARHR
jgi:hypothetical protein